MATLTQLSSQRPSHDWKPGVAQEAVATTTMTRPRRIHGQTSTNQSWLPLSILWLHFLAVTISATPVESRVDRRQGKCFERLITNRHITKRLGRCIIYVGVIGMQRALWGFELANGRTIKAYQDANTKAVVVSGRAGYLYSPSRKTPDNLNSGQYFCLGYKGSNHLICGLPEDE